MNYCFISISSNIQQPIRQIHQAWQALKALPASYMVKKSTIIATQPWGYSYWQPVFFNNIVHLCSRLSAHKILLLLKQQEKKQLRLRNKSTRSIDLDLLNYNQQVYHTPNLILPHQHLLNRAFLQPLLKQVNFPSSLRQLASKTQSQLNCCVIKRYTYR